MTKYENARIAETHLGSDDHGGFTAYITLDYGDGAHQGFGGYDLQAGNACVRFIKGVLEAAEVEFWEQLLGRPLRVEIEGGHIKAIAPLIGGDWFDLKRHLLGDYSWLVRFSLSQKIT